MSSRNSGMQHGNKEGSKPICMHSNSRVLISSRLVNMLFEAAWEKNIQQKCYSYTNGNLLCPTFSTDVIPLCIRFFIRNLLFPPCFIEV